MRVVVVNLSLVWAVLMSFDNVDAFVALPSTTTSRTTIQFGGGSGSSLSAAGFDVDKLSDIGFAASCEKPLGVVFGENDEPYAGLVIDDISEGLNGGKAGLRIGDQLLAVNGASVVGQGFDEVMSLLQESPSTLDLVLYRGPVRMLYTILENTNADMGTGMDDDSEEAVVMDENYESPVRINVDDYDDSPLSVGDVVNVFKNVAKSLTADDGEKKEASPPPKKEKGGLFGGLFQQETIQLDGNDATGLGSQKRKQ